MNETEITENNTKMLVCLKQLEAQSFLVGGFCGYSKYLKSFSIHLKPTQEIHGKQVPKYDFNK